MAETIWQKRARLRREKQKAEAKRKSDQQLKNIAKAQEKVNDKKDKDELAQQRAKREQRRRNQGK